MPFHCALTILVIAGYGAPALSDHGSLPKELVWDEVTLLQTASNVRVPARPVQPSVVAAPKHVSRNAFALLHQTSGQTPFDPPGAPCLNCDEDGNYRVPNRTNCTVQDAERETLESTKSHLAQNPFDYEFVDSCEDTCFAVLALVCTDYFVDNGGLDAVFDVLKNAQRKPSPLSTNDANWMEMRGWQALSDHSVSGDGAPLIANYGGPNKGIEFMTERLKLHHHPYELKYDTPARQNLYRLTLRYEITMNIQGLLGNDQTYEWGKAFVQTGFLEEALYTMRVETEKCSPIWATCDSLKLMLQPSNPYAGSYKAKLLSLGAEDTTRNARDACTPYQPDGDEMFMAGYTYAEVYPASESCGALLDLLRS